MRILSYSLFYREFYHNLRVYFFIISTSELTLFIAGSIPSSLFNISSLQVIQLGFNNFAATHLSSDMFDHLPNLQSLELSGSKLSGRIPPSLFKCKELQYIYLFNNQLEGTVPVQVSNLTSLKVLNIRGNNFVGKLKSTCFTNVFKNKRVHYCRTLFSVVVSLF